MDTTKLNLSPPKTPDVAEGGLLEADCAREMLFDEILEQLAACDLFSNPAHAPTIFPVYAHKNDAVGVSHENCVHDLIRWLQRVKARVLSDKSALPPLVSKQEKTSAQRNILSNQIRLLPTGKSAKPGETGTTIDKVIVCASDVLERYCETENAKNYMEHIRNLCDLNGGQSMESIEARIRQEVEGETSKDDFHHVLTELAFLQARKSHLVGDHGIVPLALNGAYKLPYLSFFGSTDLTLKLDSPTPPALHKLFFKLLEQLFVEEKDLVKECKKCYDEVITELNLESGEPSSIASFHNCLRPKISNMYQNHWSAFSTAMRNGKYVAYAGKVGKHTFQIVDKMKEQERLRILQWISPTGAAPMHGKYRDTNTKRLDGTCDWIIHHEAFRRWHTSHQSAILSLSGSMGTGKTYTTSRVIDWIGSCLDGSDYDEAFAYFYCIKQEESRRVPKTILRSLVRQVASGPWNRREDDIALDGAIMETWKKHSTDKFYDTFDDWKECFFNLLRKYPRTTIVLDALDECMEKDRQTLVRLLDELNARSSGESSIKIFVATRPESDLKEWLWCHDAIRMQERVAADIATFLRSKIEQHNRWSRSTHDFKEYVIDTLVEKSQEMFLYASLQIDILLDCKLKDDIQDALNELPEDLNEAYKEIYNAATKRTAEKLLIDRALQWVLCSARPLTSSELLFAICQDSEADVIVATDPEVNEDLVLGLCHNLLSLDRPLDSHKEGPRVWRLAHQAVAEFCEKSASFGQKAAHCEVGHVCLMILIGTFSTSPDSDRRGSYDSPKRNKAFRCPCRENLGLDDSAWSRSIHTEFQKPLVEYANYAWPSHVRAQEQLEPRGVGELIKTLQQFLGKPNEGSVVYKRWAKHSFGCEAIAPSWSMFVDQQIRHTTLEPMMAPLSLACYLGLQTVLVECWDSSNLNLDVWYCDEYFTPWEHHFWRLPRHSSRPLRWSLMALACAHNQATIFKCLLDRGARFHTAEEDEIPPIVSATIGDSAEVVSELIHLIADMRSPLRRWHEHILACAIKCNSLKAMGPLMDWLLSEPYEVEHGLASIAMQDFCSAKAITMLLDKGIDVNMPIRDGNLLAAAASHGWEDLVRRLLKEGADVNKQFDEPHFGGQLIHNALEASLSTGYFLPISRVLVEHGARVNTRAVAIICDQYWWRGDPVGALQLLLSNMQDPNETWTLENNTSTCALVQALQFGIVDQVKLLIERGAVVNPWVGNEKVDTLNIVFETTLSYRRGWGTALSYRRGSSGYPTGELIEALVGAGAGFEHLKGYRLDNALVAAAEAGLTRQVQDLLKCGADPNALLLYYRYPTALSAAAASQHPQAPDVIRVLLDSGADVNTYFPEPTRFPDPADFPEPAYQPRSTYFPEPRGSTSLSPRVALEFPLWYMLDTPLDVWLRSASVLLERGAIWDIDFAQWRTCLENKLPEFALPNAQSLDLLQGYWIRNRNSNPRVASDECWKIKGADAPYYHKRKVLYEMGHILKEIEYWGAWDEFLVEEFRI